MFSSSDHYASAGKAFLEAQIAAFAEMAAITTRSTEKILALNVAAAKAASEESILAMQELVASKDPQAFFWRACALAKSKGEKLAVYNSRLVEVGTLAKAEFAKITDSHVSDLQNTGVAFVNSFGRHAPPVRKT
jgi:phasin family protein